MKEKAGSFHLQRKIMCPPILTGLQSPAQHRRVEATVTFCFNNMGQNINSMEEARSSTN